MPRPLRSIKKTLPNIFPRKAVLAGGQVFVGLSGGVDSAVSAALLKKAGYDVTGVFIKVWQPDFLPCNWRDERRDAMRVAIALDIPFLFFDFEKSEVRKLARKSHLPVSEKKDSQGVCFIGEIRMDEFLSHFVSTKSGKV